MTETIDRTARVNSGDTEVPPEEPTQWETLCSMSEGLTWKLTPELDRLNVFADLDHGARELFQGVAQRYRKIQSRHLCHIRPHGTKVVLDAIVSRTVDFRKFAEKITYKQFANGVVDKSGRKLLLDEDGVPIFQGLEMDERTVARSIDNLLRTRLIERFKFTKGTTVVYAYMPFPREFLAVNLAALVEGHFGSGSAKAAEYHATIENMLGMIETRWPAGERLPYWIDYNIQGFYQGDEMPTPIYSDKAKADDAKKYVPQASWGGRQK